MSVKLRHFVKLDGQGKIVPGYLISRQKRPKMLGSKFMEIFAPNCCPDDVVTVTSTGTPNGTSEVTITALCGSVQLFTYVATSSSNAITANLLNSEFPAIATWSSTTSTITATNPICDELTFTVAYAQPA